MARLLALLLAAAALLSFPPRASAGTKDLLTPPRGMRTWSQFGLNVNQSLMTELMDAIVARTHTAWRPDPSALCATKKGVPCAPGTVGSFVPTSFADLGYLDVGLDDGWQLCNSGENGKGYHNASGYPQVDTSKFPDFRAMTAYAHSLNLTAGWYGNNCHCADEELRIENFFGDVLAFNDFGFDNMKVDSCGAEQDVQLWSTLLNQSRTEEVVLENCHNGPWLPEPPRKPGGDPWCPFSFYRSSLDIRADYFSVFGVNLQTVVPLANEGLSFPSCWAYPDMLEVGVTPGLHKGEAGLTVTESRSHFGAWCIASSPLVLSLDVRNASVVGTVWDIVSNVEALAVNEAWAAPVKGYVGGPVAYSGTRILASNASVVFTPCGWFPTCSAPAWEIWSKPLPEGAAALFFVNHANTTLASVSISLLDVPLLACAGAGGCALRDVWAHADLGTVTTAVTVTNLASHDSAFYTLTAPA